MKRRSSRSRPCLISRKVSSLPGVAGIAEILLSFWLGSLAACVADGVCAPVEIEVSAINVAGAVRTGPSAILNTFGLTQGKTYPYDEVRKGLGRVFSMGFYDDVRLYSTPAPAGHALTIEVVERPVVLGVKISENKKIGKDDIRAKAAIAAGSSLDPRLVHESLTQIRALYREKGFYLADVRSEVEPVGDSGVNLTFKIEEGSKVKVGGITVLGNERVSARRIKRAMETKERGWFRRKDFNPEKFEEDLEKVVRLYRDEGYVNAEITSHDVKLDEKKAVADLTISVAEGSRVFVRSVKIDLSEGAVADGAVSDKTLAENVVLAPGLPFSQTDYEKSLQGIYSVLADYGYIYARVEPEESVERDSMNLTFRIEPSRAVRIEKVTIEGNETTFEKVIRRELMVSPGDILRRTLIERSQREVFNLGHFEDVEITSRVVNDSGDIDLIFRVKERTTGIANVGAGYSEEFGLTGFLEFSHNNIGWFRKPPYLGLGKGESLNLRWEFGRLTQIELGYRNPWFRDRPTLVGVDIYDTKREYDRYDDKRDGVGLVAGRRFPLIDYSRIYLRYRLERREIVPDEATASAAVKAQAGSRTTSSVIATFLRNSVDSPFFPRTGSRTSITAEWAGSILGGDTGYQTYVFESSSFMPVPLLESAFLAKTRLGLIDRLGRKGYIPIYERFRLGGTTADGVRGYTDREIVPDGNAVDEGGRFMIIQTFEYRVPVVKNRAFLLGFVEAGNTWNSVRASRPGFLKTSAGAGFRIEIPMVGTIGLDLGYGFDREDDLGGPGWETHFQFGTAGF